MLKKPRILICDDDDLFHQSVTLVAQDDFICESAYNTTEALELIKLRQYDVILLDIEMRTLDEGIEAIPKLRAADPQMAIIMSSGRSDLPSIRRAMNSGAVDFLSKDFELEEFVHTLNKTVRRLQLERSAQQYQFESNSIQQNFSLIGSSSATLAIRRLIAKYKGSPLNVLITGETGTGKEVVARQLRAQEPNGSWVPFIAVDSATIQSSTAESHLFGHERGAFTGADKAKKGLFEEADGGDIYFDELANMPLAIQSKLLRAIQEKEIVRLGSSRPIHLQFRVISATNADLKQRVSTGEFKEDLLQRLDVLPIKIPPLRERKDDIPDLVEEFTRRYAPGRQGVSYTKAALECLQAYSWPGNIRELGNVIGYALTMAESEEIDLTDLPEKILDYRSGAETIDLNATAGPGYSEQMKNFERSLLEKALVRAGGSAKKAAEELGMARSHFYAKLKQLGISTK